MSKRLITDRDVLEGRCGARIVLDGETLITPSARDRAMRLDIVLVEDGISSGAEGSRLGGVPGRNAGQDGSLARGQIGSHPGVPASAISGATVDAATSSARCPVCAATSASGAPCTTCGATRVACSTPCATCGSAATMSSAACAACGRTGAGSGVSCVSSGGAGALAAPQGLPDGLYLVRVDGGRVVSTLPAAGPGLMPRAITTSVSRS
jgi:hypothetical protein